VEIIPFSPDLLPALTELVNEYIVHIPPYWTLSKSQVQTTISQAQNLWQVHYPEQTDSFRIETLCARSDGNIVAALQWGFPEDLAQDKAQTRDGVLFWCFTKPKQPGALLYLLETITEHARVLGCLRLQTSRFSFGIGWMGIPVCWSHLIEGLLKAGFTVYREWVLYGREGLPAQIPLPDSLPSMQVEFHEDPSVLEMDATIWHSHRFVGECNIWGIPSHFTVCPGYSQWTTIEWLGIEQEYRRRGLGNWLLLESMRQQAKRGVSHFLCWAVTGNDPIRRLNEQAGFQALVEIYEFEIRFD
jgi:GNAT superfamily N-acetyltransferase